MIAADKKLILDQRSRDRDTRFLINTTLIALFVMGILIGSGVYYTKWESHRQVVRSNRLWCAMIIGLDDNYRAAPPGSLPPRTLVFATQIRDLRRELDCPDTPQPAIVYPSTSPTR